ncbi:MAG: hypothetical protein ACI9QD_001074, partial [Thermoproteota archaeon]
SDDSDSCSKFNDAIAENENENNKRILKINFVIGTPE